jgi:type II secretory pathway pseudopilin PulG
MTGRLARLRPGDFRAFSLLEVIISFALLAMLLTLIFSFLVPTLRVSARAETRLEMQERAMIVLARIQQDLTRSTEAGLSLDSVSLKRSPVPPTTMLSDSPSPVPSNVALVIQELPQPEECGPPAVSSCQQHWSTNLIAYTWDSATENVHRKEYNAASAFAGATVCPATPNPIMDGVVSCQYPTRLFDAEVLKIMAAQLDSDRDLKQDEILATHVTYFIITMAEVGTNPDCPLPDPGYVVQPLNFHLGMREATANGAATPESLDIQRWMGTRNLAGPSPGPTS